MSVMSQAQPPPYQDTQILLNIGTVNDREENITVVEQSEEELAAVENHKQNIYKHPLFPLMALLFDKCEQVTQSSDFPSSESFDSEIQAFLDLQRKENKPLFSDDLELDGLMVKAIQVLRIHLLEMEKVTDLCKDFCTRYISCLKGKLQSESLLKVELYDSDEDESVSPGGTNQYQTSVQNQPMVTQVVNGVMMQPNVQQSALSMATISQGQIISGNTVYQMVQTPQGIVAQPIQIQTAPVTNQVIQSNTPGTGTSQILSSPMVTQQHPPSTPSTPQTPGTPNMSFFDDDDPTGKRNKNKRGVLPKQATQVMKSWLFQHIVHPYPTEDEKKTIAGQTNLTLLQVNNWFINARRRILQPMMDSGNPEQKTKKKQTPTQPKQRFWPESIANITPQIPNTESPNLKTETESTIESPAKIVSMVTPNGEIIRTSTSGLILDSTMQPVTFVQTAVTNSSQIIPDSSTANS